MLIQNAVTGEHSCMVLKPLHNNDIEADASDQFGFLGPFYQGETVSSGSECSYFSAWELFSTDCFFILRIQANLYRTTQLESFSFHGIQTCHEVSSTIDCW